MKRNGENAKAARGPFRQNVSRAVALVLLFTVAAIVESVRLSSLRDPDIWLHLQMGSWILAHRTWPATGLFSQAANLPWRDFTWGCDLLVAVAYRVLGLHAIPALWMLFRLVLAALTFCLACGSRVNFWAPVTVSAVAQYLLYGTGPVGAGASVVFFGVELFALIAARRSTKSRHLFLLPLLFFLWANLDIGFVYGIGLYVLYLAALAIERTGYASIARWVSRPPAAFPLRVSALAGAMCLIATLLSPYGYHAYFSFFAIQGSPANRYLYGHTAMTFHQPQDYLLLLFAMAAFLSLGIRHSRDLFLLPVLIVCTAVSFHAQGESWLATLAAVAVIGDALRPKEGLTRQEPQKDFRRSWGLAMAASILVVSLAFVLRVPRDSNLLLVKVAETFPVRASDYIRRHRLPAPLFNSYAWGSFLTWYLPEYPVAIDARRGLYSDEEETDYFKVMIAQIPYQSLPAMTQARTLLLDKKGVMADALRGLPGFQVAYEDSISIVLLQEKRE